MAKIDEVTGEGDFECDKCGRKFKHGAWYTKHAVSCRGPVATTGRIASTEPRARAVALVSRKRAAPRRRPRERKVVARLVTPGVGAIAAAATDKAIELVIAGLRTKRNTIDNAIGALEALRT